MKGSEDMFQKILSLILVVLICCSTSITVFAQTDHSHVEENHVSGGNEEPAITDTTSISSEIVPEESETLINPDYVVTAKVNPEYLERMFGAPDEILSGSTLELLEYFLESQFMRERIHSYGSSTLVEREFNFSCHGTSLQTIQIGIFSFLPLIYYTIFFHHLHQYSLVK